jgi:PAS domain S-box-containing protein
MFTSLVGVLAHRVGGPRVLALPMLRFLAILSGWVWILLTPRAAGWDLLDTTMLGFFLYSVALITALWVSPGRMLRLNFWVLVIDLAFALALIWLTGGARSTLFLALLLIAGLQSYYYGIRRGTLVALASSAAYLAVAWPTIGELDWADIVIRVLVLAGTAIGGGILADVETAERLKVLALTGEAREREEFIRSVVESLREGVVALDRGGHITAWNRAMEMRYEVSAAEVLGRDFFEVFPTVRREPWADSLRQLLDSEIEELVLEAVEHQTLRKGRVVQNLKGNRLRHAGTPRGAVLLIEDITERVGLERSARQAEKMAAVGTLAAGVAHELNNPIGIISSRIELMQLDAESQPLPDEFRKDLAVLHRHAQRVARIVQGLLSFAHQAPIEQGAVDLNRVVEETLLLIEKQIAKEEITVTRRLTPALPAVWGDANALQQVLMNLMTNARDALGVRGEIVITTGREAGPPEGVRLTVRDSGPGIPREILVKIFDPFFTTKPSGTGLGLSISYGIVRDHQGTIEVQSEPGCGTTFVLSFPASVAPPAEVTA